MAGTFGFDIDFFLKDFGPPGGIGLGIGAGNKLFQNPDVTPSINPGGTQGTPGDTGLGLAGSGFDFSSLAGLFGGDGSGNGRQGNELFNLLLGLGLAQKGQGTDILNTLFSGIEV